MVQARSPFGAVRIARRVPSQWTDPYITLPRFAASPRSISSSVPHRATPSLHPTTRRDQPVQAESKDSTKSSNPNDFLKPSYESLTPAERVARATQRARERIAEQQKKYSSSRQLGGLADNSLFADEELGSKDVVTETDDAVRVRRSSENTSFALNPRPSARTRWQKKMLIRHVQKRGRLTREMQIARTERDHVSKSHFFKTSMKKLAPLARQIAGKSIDEAILQMRFSKKKAAKEVRAHLIQARNEAVVVRGMGLGTKPLEMASSNDTLVAAEPDNAPLLPHQNPTKSIKDGAEKLQSELYIAQAWVNRGPYGMEPEFRARGRVNILRPPWTGITVLLKEEKTRIRETAEKEAKAIKKRMGKSMWLQLPDRPVTRQSQQILW